MLYSSFTHLKPLSRTAGVKIKYGADLAPRGPLFFIFSTSVFANLIALGGTNLLKLATGRLGLRQSLVLYNRGCTVEVL